jgi:hypothetical protein
LTRAPSATRLRCTCPATSLPSCAAVDFVLTAEGFIPVDGRSHALIVEGKTFQGTLDDGCTEFGWKGAAELEFSAPAEAFLARTVARITTDAHPIDAGVYSLVDDRRGDGSRGYIATIEERELGNAGALVGDPGAAAGEPHDANLVEVALEVTQPPRLVALDESKRFVESLENIRGRYIRAGVLDDNGDVAEGGSEHWLLVIGY